MHRFLVFLSLLIWLGPPQPCGADIFEYLINGAPGPDSYTLNLTATQLGFTLESLSQDRLSSYTATLDSQFRTLSFRQVDRKGGTDVQGVVDSGRLKVVGRLRGRDIARDFAMGSQPFLHFFSFQLRNFILSPQTRTEFISLRPDTMEPFRFEATKIRKHTLSVLGAPTEVWDVRINLSGFMSVFWSTQVSFTVAEGLFVKDEGRDSEGRPMVSTLYRITRKDR